MRLAQEGRLIFYNGTSFIGKACQWSALQKCFWASRLKTGGSPSIEATQERDTSPTFIIVPIM
jgi:hypothetical protein